MLIVCDVSAEQIDDGYHRGKYTIEIFLTEYVGFSQLFFLNLNVRLYQRYHIDIMLQMLYIAICCQILTFCIFCVGQKSIQSFYDNS